VLQDGTVLVVGGTRHSFFPFGYRGCIRRQVVLSSAELFK